MPKRTQRGGGNFQEDPSGYLNKWSQRHAAAEEIDRGISALAFPGTGPHPGVIETMAGEDPESIGFSVAGPLGPHHMLTANQTLDKWEVPPLPPSHGEGFGSSVATNQAEGNIADVGTLHGNHMERWLGKVAGRMGGRGSTDPLGAMVANRKESIETSLASGDPDAAWYQGKAQAMIHHAAEEHDVPVPLMRKTVAAESPRMKWDMTYVDNPANRKSGKAGTTVFPNVSEAGRIVEAAKGRTPDEAAEEVAAQGIPGVGRQSAARVAASMMTGTMRGSDPIPKVGESEKIDTFDVNLSDPTHSKYGYSPWVHRHQLSGHTADVQDARAAGMHEDQMAVPSTGKALHEDVLMHPAGADIAQSTALVSRAEVFHEHRQRHGEEWAKANALNFMAGPSQSMQWSVNRAEGTVDIPTHVAESYANRPAPTGFEGYSGKGTRITKRDREQM